MIEFQKLQKDTESLLNYYSNRCLQLEQALQTLIDHADASDGNQYGTLSTKWVRDIALDALIKPTNCAPSAPTASPVRNSHRG